MGVHESTACRIVTKVGNALIGSGKFHWEEVDIKAAANWL